MNKSNRMMYEILYDPSELDFDKILRQGYDMFVNIVFLLY